jgi:hypothetical protein
VCRSCYSSKLTLGSKERSLCVISGVFFFCLIVCLFVCCHTFSCGLFIYFQGFDEYMNIVLDNAEEINMKKKTSRKLGLFSHFHQCFLFRQFGCLLLTVSFDGFTDTMQYPQVCAFIETYTHTHTHPILPFLSSSPILWFFGAFYECTQAEFC